MSKIIKALFLMVSVIFIPDVISSPTGACSSSAMIEKELTLLSIDPSIKTNKELLRQVEFLYGVEFVKRLVQLHPVLHHSPNKGLDLDTLGWFSELIWNTEHARTRFEFFFPKDITPDVMKEFVFNLVDLLWNIGVRVIPVYQNALQASTVNAYLKSNLDNILKEHQPYATDSELLHLKKRVKDNYIENNNYLIGLNNITLSNPLISITGHGRVGKDTISLGNKSYLTKDIVETMNDSGINKNSAIELKVCFSGCSNRNFNKTVSELRGLFTSGLLQEQVSTEEDTLLSHFSDAVDYTLPDFEGMVSGYIGALEAPTSDDVLNRDGTISKEGFAVALTGVDGELLVNREQAMIFIEFPRN